MCNRQKPMSAEELANLKNEIDTIEKFTASAVKESVALDALAKTRILTKKENERAQELIDYIHNQSVRAVKLREEYRAHYAPAN